jgi:hypothetical protein
MSSAGLAASPRPGAGERASGWLAAALLGAALVCFLVEAWEPRPQLDDAYISYRYARNLVTGSGLVFNPGERVEGITNLLWTLGVAGGIGLGLDGKLAGHALGVASGAAVLLFTFLLAGTKRSRRDVWVAAVAPWIVLAAAPFSAWSTSGMETPLFAATTTAALAAFARDRLGWTTAALVLATLTRPDGVILAAVVYGLALLRHGRHGRALRRGWLPPLAYALALALLTVFRLAYYGSPLPNTFYAKTGGVPFSWGIRYVAEFLGGGAGWLLIPALFAAARDRTAWPALGFVALQSLYVVWIGGDAFPHSRFLVPALPCLAALGVMGTRRAFGVQPQLGVAMSALLAAALARFVLGTALTPTLLGVALLAGLGALCARFQRWGILRAGALVLLSALAGVLLRDAVAVARRGAERPSLSARGDIRWRAVRGAQTFESIGIRRAALLLGRRERGEPIRLVATGAIGSLGYFSDLPLLDIYGLVDETIARSQDAPRHADWAWPGHARSNADYVFSREPDYILIPRRSEPIPVISSPAQVGLWKHPDLAAFYDWDEVVKGYRRRAPRAE